MTWNLDLPKPPAGFPNGVHFELTRDEALFIRDRITLSHPESLLSWLALEGRPTDISAPWRHPNFGSMSDRHKDVLEHARRFSVMMHGASLLYNVLLARLSQSQEIEDRHSEAFEKWCQEITEIALDEWSLESLWELTVDDEHRITWATRSFVESWISLVKSDRYGILGSDRARELIRGRETSLKKTQSRFSNRDALQQWGGGSGLGRLNYRWQTAQIFLNDLYRGFSL